MKQLLRNVAASMALALSCSTAMADVTELIKGDFSTLTAGSEDAPEMFKYASSFSSLFKDWRIDANKAGQAGGSLYITDGGTLRTPYASGVSTTGGAIKVTIEVKLNKAEAGIIQMQWGYSSATSMTQIVEGTDWTTVDFFVQPTSASSYSNYATIAPQWLADGMFIKTVTVAQAPEFLAPPVVNQPTNADGTSFTATWKAVTGATKYFVDVYSYNADGDKVYFLENMETTTTSYRVEGLDAATTYYFVVRAANDEGVSANSAEIEVVKYVAYLEAPAVSLTECDADGNYTVTWDAVADADSYTITVFRSYAMTEEGEGAVLSENFNVFTAGTLSSVEYIYPRHLEALNEPGWDGYNMACINGAIGLTPYGSGAYLMTPALDLSNNEGKYKVKVNMAVNNFGTFYTGESVTFETLHSNPDATSADDAFLVVDTKTITLDQAAFADYTVELTGGNAETRVKVSSTTSYKIFFDDFEVLQLLPAGTTTTATYATDDTEATTYSGKVEFGEGVSYKLVAVANGRTVSGGQISGISSNASESVEIKSTEDDPTGMTDVSTEAHAVTISKAGAGSLAIDTPEAATAGVYDLSGRLIATFALQAGSNTVSLNATGVVLVKVGATVAKIAL